MHYYVFVDLCMFYDIVSLQDFFLNYVNCVTLCIILQLGVVLNNVFEIRLHWRCSSSPFILNNLRVIYFMTMCRQFSSSLVDDYLDFSYFFFYKQYWNEQSCICILGDMGKSIYTETFFTQEGHSLLGHQSWEYSTLLDIAKFISKENSTSLFSHQQFIKSSFFFT